MNASISSEQSALRAAMLHDRYTVTHGRVFMSGVQALVRLPMLQRARDAAAGLSTAGFISGYRGSPLGTYDQALWDAKEHLARHRVVFQPGVNEELAADAVWGTQQLDLDPAAKLHDGVFGIWYAKGPGVDRSADALKHANLSGTARYGGVLAVAGDDHGSKSSTLAHQSDPTFIACGLPVFAPSNVQDILDLGLHAFAMSRYSGLWSGMKTVQEVMESASAFDLDALGTTTHTPEEFALPEQGLHLRWPDDPLAQEARLMEVKLPAALAYLRANGLNRNVVESPQDRLGIIASGKAFTDVRQALQDLGLDDTECRRLGIRLHKLAVVWPLEPQGVRDFVRGLQEVLVVEEKRPIIEQQLKDALYHLEPERRPRISGKQEALAHEEGDPGARWLLRPSGELSSGMVAQAIARRLLVLGVPPETGALLRTHLAALHLQEATMRDLVAPAERKPWFCPGCPHNTSTRVPEGSVATAGIGCHGMAVWMDRSTSSWTQMGGEGTPWVGQAPFSKRKHMFANLGDGTYNHSGLLAIRQAIAAKVDITYKILFNGAVAMTGGQPVDGGLGVPAMTRELEAEGVRRIAVVTDQPENYANGAGLAPGVEVYQRDQLDAVQKQLREVAGVTAIIYAQECATKKRRERKRGKRPDATKRAFINELVCEGCGDCGVQSNCVAVRPLETEFGRKREVHQGSCNMDLSCLKGFCPSFVTVEGGKLRSPEAALAPALPPPPMEPLLPALDTAWGIVVAGIGGTGVVTIGQILGMAAHIEGMNVVTQDAMGMAQMGGSTWSYVQIAPTGVPIAAPRVAAGNAHLVIACDALVGAQKTTLALLRKGRTRVVLNSHSTPTSDFVRNADWHPPHERCAAVIAEAIGADAVHTLDAESLATRLLGAPVLANMLLLGCAWQLGRVPLQRASIVQAIELNGVQVAQNVQAFEWGRQAALLDSSALLPETGQVVRFAPRVSLDQRIAQRAAFLRSYQNVRYAGAFTQFVEKVQAAEASFKSTRLSEAVCTNLFKLMAYKDEYEVARLHSSPEFAQALAAQFKGPIKLTYHLAPPLFARRNESGEMVKRPFGAWMGVAMRALAGFRFLRGSVLDPFGYTSERRMERRLIADYRARIEQLLPELSADRLSLAVQIASVPQQIRGYGHVKERNMAAASAAWDGLTAEWRTGPPTSTAGRSLSAATLTAARHS